MSKSLIFYCFCRETFGTGSWPWTWTWSWTWPLNCVVHNFCGTWLSTDVVVRISGGFRDMKGVLLLVPHVRVLLEVLLYNDFYLEANANENYLLSYSQVTSKPGSVNGGVMAGLPMDASLLNASSVVQTP